MARKELHPDDLPVYQPIEIDASDLDSDVAPDIIKAEPRDYKADYLDELKFNEEFVDIFLYRGREEYAPNTYTFWVNGRQVSIPVEQRVSVRRKYVEIMLRSQPYSLTTHHTPPNTREDGFVENTWRRHQSAQYPLSIVEDKNPRGKEWAERVARQG